MTRLIQKLSLKWQSFVTSRLTPNRQVTPNRQGGAALIIVIAMTGMLAFLGFFFYNFVAQERNSAMWFALPRQTVQDTDYFDFALEQVLIGPTDDRRNSALYGRKFALVPGVIGSLGADLKPTDFTPYNGKGLFAVPGNTDNNSLPDLVNGTDGPNGTAGDWDDNIQFQGFDFDGDGTADALTMNFSPIANPGNPADPLIDQIPYSPLNADHPFSVFDYQPDVDYTYPDINNMFLSHAQWVDIDPTPGGINLKLCWIPSYHRPQYLPREPRTGANSIFVTTDFRNMVLRPHAAHVTRRRRNQDASLRYNAADFNNFQTAIDGTNFNTGIWQMTNPSTAAAAAFIPHYDVDADGLSYNGNEAILLDLDHEPEVLSDGSLRVPMFAFTIMDLDGLINLNMAGNLFNEQSSLIHRHTSPVQGSDDPFGYDNPNNPDWVHTSNYGYSTTEVNPCWGFWRPVNSSAAPGSYSSMFAFSFDSMSGTQLVSQIDMSNMELARLLLGYADGSDANNNVTGRWGEDSRTFAAIAGTRPAPTPLPVDNNNPYALPGRSLVDDDLDFQVGGGKARFSTRQDTMDPVFGPLNISLPSTVHPLDELGTGGSFGLNVGNSGNYFPNRTFSGAVGGTNGLYSIASQRFDANDYNPSRWLSHQGFWEAQMYNGLDGTMAGNAIDNQLALSGVNPYYNGPVISTASSANNPEDWLQRRLTGGSLPYRGLGDEPDEFEPEPLLRDTTFDAAFTPSELQYLHLSNTDWSKLGISGASRIGQLVEYNLERLAADDGNFTTELNRYLRSQFTTDSWDRREPGGFPAPTTFDNSTVSDRNWEYTAEQFTLDPGTYGPNRYIAVWPPVYNNAFQNNSDPFRYALRRQLNRLVAYISASGTNIDQFIHVPDEYKQYQGVGTRLNLNQVLEVDPQNSSTTRYRALTPHPVFDGSETVSVDAVPDMLHFDVPPSAASLTNRPVRNGGATPANYNVTFNAINGDKVAQEWWARYDRQRMARDIYVLMYTFCLPDDFDPTAGPLTILNDADGNGVDDRIDEIAQFAVNYVDAIDADDVITRFDYDFDLSDGWDTTYAGTGRATVFGVEHQQLTFSETLWIHSEEVTGDDPKTPWDDGTERDFLFIELRNAAPKELDLSRGSWRIKLVEQGTDAPYTPVGGTRELTFWKQNSTSNTLTVGAGENFLIGTYSEDTSWDSLAATTTDAAAVFAPEYDSGSAGTFGPVVPYLRHADTTPAQGTPAECYDLPLCDLDLNFQDAAAGNVHDAFDQQYFEENAQTKGYLIAFDRAGGTNPPANAELVLERRMNTRLWSFFDNDPDNVDDANDNDWIEVDRISIVQTTFNPSTYADFNTLQSQERRQPLFPSNTLVRSEINTSAGPLKHTLGGMDPGAGTLTTMFSGTQAAGASYAAARKHQKNSTLVAEGYSYWQPHFDRPLTSVIDLFQIPVLAPKGLIADVDQTVGSANWGGLVRGDNFEQTGHRLAERRFLNPDPDGTINNADDNRWHRLLELVDVPNRHEDRNARLLATPRKAGRVNLNTIRHPTVLGAVIDDQYHLAGLDPASGLVTTLNPEGDSNTSSTEAQFYNSTVQMLQDPNENNRNWADQFFMSRDVIDPVTGDPLPGIPGSRPFRGTGHKGFTDETTDISAFQGTENTLLRTFAKSGVGGLTENDSINRTNTGRRLLEARTDSGGLNQIDSWARNRLLSKVSNLTTNRSHTFACWIHVQFHDATEDANGNIVVGAPRTGEVMKGFFVLDRSRLEEAFDPRSGRFDFQKFVISRTILDQ